ncbi:MAG: hypothetical protein ACPIDY_08070 [Candidatus Puniceispirillaceae bacterium]|jgi:hypothetical protein
MSPEQSSKRAGIYEKLALKDKLESNKQRQSLLLLTEELDKNEQIKAQLTRLIEENLKEVKAQSGMALQSASWFSTKVRDQLELVQNRCQHLEIEIDEMRKKLAHAERRRSRKTEKADALYKQARQARQDAQDAALSERGRRLSPR